MASCTAPINIIPNSQTDKICKLKCSYQFTYTRSAVNIMNLGSYLYLTFDPAAAPPVIYNDQNYNVSGCVLVTPSIHTYNGSRVDAELIIIHVNSANKKLYVCIPIKGSSKTADDSASFFDMIIAEVSQTAPSEGGTAVFNNSIFTLNKFVPMTPFFSYTGTDMLHMGKCSKTQVDYVVFNNEDAIKMSSQALKMLKKVIPTPISKLGLPNPVDESMNPGGVHYNPAGPISPYSNDIYIDCRPTGDEGEVLVAQQPDTTSFFDNVSLSSSLNSNVVKIILGLILMIFIWKVMIKTVNGITASALKMKGGSGSIFQMKGGRGLF